jgi:hypothetical protein
MDDVKSPSEQLWKEIQTPHMFSKCLLKLLQQALAHNQLLLWRPVAVEEDSKFITIKSPIIELSIENHLLIRRCL